MMGLVWRTGILDRHGAGLPRGSTTGSS
jgi:hypothetical protein